MKARYTVVNGEVIAEKRGVVRKTYVPDPLGSTIALLDNTQSKTDTFSYWPYGEVKTRTGTTATPFRFVGIDQFQTTESNRLFVGRDFYLAKYGRWISPGSPFDYADGNPVSTVQTRPLRGQGPATLPRPTKPPAPYPQRTPQPNRQPAPTLPPDLPWWLKPGLVFALLLAPTEAGCANEDKLIAKLGVMAQERERSKKRKKDRSRDRYRCFAKCEHSIHGPDKNCNPDWLCGYATAMNCAAACIEAKRRTGTQAMPGCSFGHCNTQCTPYGNPAPTWWKQCGRGW